MCFAPQRRALFRQLNFQKWSEHGVFCTFWLPNVLRATTACTFSTSQLPKVVWPWCALCVFTWKCASRHNGVHFFDIATSKSGPTPRCFVHFDFAPQRRAIFHHSSGQLAPHPRFSEPTFRPSGATNHWKNTVFRDFPTFSRICIFFLLTLSLLLFFLLIFLFSLPLPCSAFHLSILSEVWLLNFLRPITVGNEPWRRNISKHFKTTNSKCKGTTKRHGRNLHVVVMLPCLHMVEAMLHIAWNDKWEINTHQNLNTSPKIKSTESSSVA